MGKVLKGDPDNAAQVNRFKKTAKEVGADESEAAFEDKLRRIAKSQTKKEKPAD